MKKICFVNGSPKNNNSVSDYFIDEIQKLIESDDLEMNKVYAVKELKTGKTAESFEKIIKSDTAIFVFPLYVDSIPSTMLDFLWKLENYIDKNEIDKNDLPDLYAVINCGFLEGNQDENALKIIQSFSEVAGFSFKFGIGIGGGEFMKGSKDSIPFESKIKRNIYDALCKLKDSIQNNEGKNVKNIFVSPNMPKSLFMFFGDKGWVKEAKRNNVKKNDILKKVY